MNQISEPAQTLLLALHDHVARTGASPIVRELADALERPIASVQYLVGTLVRAGYATRGRSHRTLALTSDGHRMVAVLKGWPAENMCEHGDHPAPAGQRFCSEACAMCDAGAQPCSIECVAQSNV